MVMNVRDKKFLLAFGKNVRELRLQKSLSQYKLSYDSNISRSQIIAIENGQINTTICTLYALAKGLEIPPKKLMDFEIEPS